MGFIKIVNPPLCSTKIKLRQSKNINRIVQTSIDGVSKKGVELNQFHVAEELFERISIASQAGSNYAMMLSSMRQTLNKF